MVSKQEQRRNRVEKFIELNPDESKSSVVKRFVAEGNSKRTIYSIIKRLADGIPMKRKVGSGLKPKIFNRKKLFALKTYYNHNDKRSYTSGAKKFGCHRETIKYWLNKLNIKRRCKKKVPFYKEGQDKFAQGQCGYLHYKFRKKQFIIDDESYFTLKRTTNKHFFSNDVNITPDDVKYKKTRKFEPKVLLWIAISENGMSKPYLQNSGMAINQKIYQNECLEKRLFKFIEEKHSDKKYVFWPDKASSHYANATIKLLKDNKVNFIPKHLNPINVPQCKPIEDFFGYLKSIVYKDGWQAKDTKQLKKKIISSLKKVDSKIIQRSMLGVRKRLRKCYLNGVYAVCH